jgi:hypothetical protein
MKMFPEYDGRRIYNIVTGNKSSLDYINLGQFSNVIIRFGLRKIIRELALP